MSILPNGTNTKSLSAGSALQQACTISRRLNNLCVNCMICISKAMCIVTSILYLGFAIFYSNSNLKNLLARTIGLSG